MQKVEYSKTYAESRITPLFLTESTLAPSAPTPAPTPMSATKGVGSSTSGGKGGFRFASTSPSQVSLDLDPPHFCVYTTYYIRHPPFILVLAFSGKSICQIDLALCLPPIDLSYQIKLAADTTIALTAAVNGEGFVASSSIKGNRALTLEGFEQDLKKLLQCEAELKEREDFEKKSKSVSLTCCKL